MLKITLLNMLYHEFDFRKIPEVDENKGGDRRFRTCKKAYPAAAGIESVTMEERFLPRSVLYYVWINDDLKEADINDENLCRWIFAFVKEYCPAYLKENATPESGVSGKRFLDLFLPEKIPDYRDHRAYSDLTITTMEEVKNKTYEKDVRQATFPGLRFAKNHRRENHEK